MTEGITVVCNSSTRCHSYWHGVGFYNRYLCFSSSFGIVYRSFFRVRELSRADVFIIISLSTSAGETTPWVRESAPGARLHWAKTGNDPNTSRENTGL